MICYPLNRLIPILNLAYSNSYVSLTVRTSCFPDLLEYRIFLGDEPNTRLFIAAISPIVLDAPKLGSQVSFVEETDEGETIDLTFKQLRKILKKQAG